MMFADNTNQCISYNNQGKFRTAKINEWYKAKKLLFNTEN